MENSGQKKETTGIQWKLIPPKDFLRTIEVGQYLFSKRSSSEVIAAKADEKLRKITTELNESIDKLEHQPGGGDHPALERIWNKLDRKLIKEFDLYMQVVDKSQLLNLPKGASILDVTPAFGLIYSKVVEVPLADLVLEDPSQQVVTGGTGELGANVEMGEQGGEEGHQLVVARGKVVQQLEQDKEANSQLEPEVNLVSGLEKDGKADSQLDLNMDSASEDEEVGPQRVPEAHEFPPLIPLVGGICEQVIWPRPNGMQAMEIEENTRERNSNAPDIVGLVAINIKMPRLEEMIEPEAMAVYWQKYNESTVKPTAVLGNPGQPLKSILKGNSSQLAQKKKVRFQVDVERETPAGQNNIVAIKKRGQKKKYELKLGSILTRAARKKREEKRRREEKKKLRFNGILLQPDLVNQARFLRSRNHDSGC